MNPYSQRLFDCGLPGLAHVVQVRKAELVKRFQPLGPISEERVQMMRRVHILKHECMRILAHYE
jgi:hypothetical protein